MEYYVYVYLDPTKPDIYETHFLTFLYEPFYIGFGSKNRMFDHIKRTYNKNNKNFNICKIRKMIDGNIQPIILKIFDNLSPEEAKILEIKMISDLGTRAKVAGIKRGPLTNLTSGGDGIIGYDMSKRKKYNHNVNDGKIGIRKNGILKLIYEKDLTEHLKLGWKKGWSSKVKSSGTKNKIWVNNGLKRLCVSENELEVFLLDGWIRGYKIPGKKTTSAGKIMINKNTVIKGIDPKQLNEYIAAGWTLGLGRKKYPASDMKWMHNGTETKYVKKDLINVHLKDGWVFGRIFK